MFDLVTVLMTVYNEKVEWIKESIESLINQSYKNIEIIIVIDKPDEKNIIDLLDDYVNKYNFIKVLLNQSNQGLAKSLNIAFQYARGTFIARMDADDVSEYSRIEKQLKILKDNPEYDLVSTNCSKIDESGKTIGEININVSNNKIKKILPINNCLVHPSWIMRRETFIKLNGYRDFECSQDYDFLLRLISSNFKIFLEKEKLIKYRVRANSISSSKAFKQYLIAKYIRRLYRERVKKKNSDSYSLMNLQNFLDHNKLKQDFYKFEKSKNIFYKLKAGENVIINIFYALVYSKYSRDLLINAVKFNILKRI